MPKPLRRPDTQPPSDLFVFTWDVDVDGYQVVDSFPIVEFGNPDTSRFARYLTDGRSLPSDSFLVNRYAPLIMEPGLFRTFARTEPHEAAILAFANRYGTLGGEVRTMIAFAPDAKGSHSRFAWGEALNEWCNRILRMRNAVSLWDMVHNNRHEQLQRHITWTETTVGYCSDPDWTPGEQRAAPYVIENRMIAARDLPGGLFSAFERGDVITPALYHLQHVINEHLQPGISPRLLWDKTGSELSMFFVPSNLIGAMWLQFAEAVGGHKNYRECRQCGRWFELHPDVARTNRLYCSPACRAKAYRARTNS